MDDQDRHPPTRVGQHLRWAMRSAGAAALALTVALLGLVIAVNPEALTRSGAAWSAVLGVLAASWILSLVPTLAVTAVLIVLDSRRPQALGIDRAYRGLSLALPLSLIAALGCQFGWVEGQLSVGSLALVAVCGLGGLALALAITLLIPRRLPAAPPSWAWSAAAVAAVLLAALPAPEVERRWYAPEDPVEAAVSDGRSTGTAAGSSGGQPGAETVVLITVDTLRADHLGFHGYARQTSPFLDRFSAEGAIVEHMVAATSCTVPSTAAILTGFWPWCSGVDDQSGRLPHETTTLAERFARAGYRTLALVANPLLSRSAGFDQGFDEFHELTGRPRFAPAAEVSAAALERIAAADGPSFAWIHYMDPHYPYLPPESTYAEFLSDEQYDASTLPVVRFGTVGGVHGHNVFYDEPHGSEVEAGHVVARYDGEIRQLDAGIRELITGLEKRGLAEHAAIALTADHGETLTGHRHYFRHCLDVYDSNVHVPALFWRGGSGIAGRRVRRPAAHIDVAPTLLALAGLDEPLGDLPGIDLLADGAGSDPGRLLFTQTGWWDGAATAWLSPERLLPTRAVVERGWKFISNPSHELAQVRGPLSLLHAWRAVIAGLWHGDELYDLTTDPTERTNLAAREPDRAARMRELLVAHPDAEALEQCPTGGDQPRLTEQERQELERKLEALGYLD